MSEEGAAQLSLDMAAPEPGPDPGPGAPAGAAPEEPEPGLEELLDRLEILLQRLADPGAPLERAVNDYEAARLLLGLAGRRLEAAAARAAAIGRGLQGPEPAEPGPPQDAGCST